MRPGITSIGIKKEIQDTITNRPKKHLLKFQVISLGIENEFKGTIITNSMNEF